MKRLLMLAVFMLPLFHACDPAEARTHTALEVVSTDGDVELYWSSSVGATHVRLVCPNYDEVRATDEFSTINGFVFFDFSGDGQCTSTLFKGGRTLERLSFAA